ncbi:MAG TPA: phage minor capsid protein, partial [Actinomycetota bacterium]|nr:phage minor capsid protein [Actinomycetota bacterium]
MPQPAEVDALADPLAAKYQAASKRILDWQIRLATDPRQESRRRRLLEQQRAILDDMAALDEEAAAWVSRQLPKVYALGGAAGASQATGGLGDFVWSQIHQTATQNIAQGLYRNLLEATKKTAETTKRLVREIGQDQALASAIEGQTAQAAGREMARLLEKQGVHAVTYANGARQAIGPYSEMAIRSVTAETYNVGTLNSAAEKGTKYWEVFDGPFCGWTSHDDSKAAGKIVTRDEALAWPTSHPNCRRAFGARPDVLTAKDAKNAKSMVSDEQTAAQVQADIEKAGKKAFREDRPSTLPEEAASGRTGLTFTDKDVLIDGHKVGTIQSSGGHWLATLDVPGRNVQYTGSSYEEVTRKLERGTRKEVAKFQAEHDPKPAPPSTPKPPDIVKPNIPNTPDYENLFRGLPTIPEIRKAHVGWTTARAEKELKRLQLERVPTVEQLTKSHVGWTRARAEKERARIIETIHNGGTPEVPKPPPKPPWKPPTPPKRPTPADIYNEVEDALAGRKFPGGRAKQVARSKEWERIAEKHGLTTQEVAELYAEGRGAPGTVKPHGPKPKPPKGLNPNNLPEDQVREFGDMVNSIRAEFGRATTANLRQLKQLFPDM